MEVRMEQKLSILLANDFPLVRKSLADLLNSFPDIDVVACANAKDEALPLAEAPHPTVCIIDLELQWPVLTDLIRKLAKGRAIS
jgi:DNA-binding NarL/FixJ family response regulator